MAPFYIRDLSTLRSWYGGIGVEGVLEATHEDREGSLYLMEIFTNALGAEERG
jgi:hypothetical protein